MKILLVADIHYALKQFDWVLEEASDFEAVCIAGDLLDVSSIVPLAAQVVVVRTYLERLAKQTRVFVCSGNHDLTEKDQGGERVAPWLTALEGQNLIRDGDALALGDTLISVLPWWDGETTKTAIARQLTRDAGQATGQWIWVYHAPPADSRTAWSGLRHFGDRELTRWIEAYRPSAVFCGHVHEAPFVPEGTWAERVGDTWVFNMGRQLGPIPTHIILEDQAREAFWFSLQGQELLDLDGVSNRPHPMTSMPEWLRA